MMIPSQHIVKKKAKIHSDRLLNVTQSHFSPNGTMDLFAKGSTAHLDAIEKAETIAYKDTENKMLKTVQSMKDSPDKMIEQLYMSKESTQSIN